MKEEAGIERRKTPRPRIRVNPFDYREFGDNIPDTGVAEPFAWASTETETKVCRGDQLLLTVTGENHRLRAQIMIGVEREFS